MIKTITLTIGLILYGGLNAQTYFSEDFEPAGGSLTQNNAWTTQIVTAHPDGYDWYHDDFGGDAFAKVSNYNATISSNSPLETWLISPLIDLSSATTPQLNFENVKRFAGDDLVVYITTDFSSASPTWIDITSQLNMDSDISSWNFVNSGNLDLSPYISTSPSTVTIAFQYIGSGTSGSTYEIDDVLISEGGVTPNNVSIYDIQFTTSSPADSPYTGQQVNTGGIVSYVRADQTYYLQSGNGQWNGIYVYDTLSNVNEGDSITLSAEVDEYFNLTELKNVTNLLVVSSGNNINASLISSLDAASENYEGCLVTVNNATCTNDNAGFGEWIIDDGSGPCNVDDFFFPFTPTLNNVYNVSGLVDFSFSNFKILPRDIDDIDEITAIIESNKIDFNFYPNPSNGLFNITLNENAIVTITDLTGKICYKNNLNKGVHIIELIGFSKGNYILNVNEKAEKLLLQ